MLRRHQLAWLDEAGWAALRAQPRDPEAAECVAHWGAQHLPLVVTRQGAEADLLALGLPAPARWNRRRIALSVPRVHVTTLGAFPLAREIGPMLPAHAREPWLLLCNSLMRMSVVSRVHGSHGWEVITGERHVRSGSDVDLHVAVGTPDAADAVVECLEAAAPWAPTIDGELQFPDGADVSWREWARWRRGEVAEVMVKRLHGVAIERPVSPLEPA
nr:Phosphoribosyl-dephospho-CoA transferase MdcG [uncultured organism]